MDEHVEEVLEREDKINAFIRKYPEEARKQAGRSGRLKNIVIGIKSCISVKGFLTSCASKTLENHIASYDATVVKRIRQEGGIILGMTNMDEFACGASGETSYYGPTDNPAAPGRIPGGSSSGSAAAVAAGYVDMALGTDTGGSIRNPASHCGVVGFKPTYGVVPRYGLLDMSMSLDQIGPIARTVPDAALLLDVIAGYDPRDATSLRTKGSYLKNLHPDLDGKIIGYAKEFDELIEDEKIRRAMHESLDLMKDHGAVIRGVSLPSLKKALPTYYLTVYVEFFSATRKYDGRRYGHRIEETCGEEVLRRIALGRYISQKEWQGKYYRRALQARTVIRHELLKALKQVDVLAGPVVPKLPHKIGEKLKDVRTMYAYDLFTVVANLAGLPAGSVPTRRASGIPVGLHIIGKPLDDQGVLNVMQGFERARDDETK